MKKLDDEPCYDDDAVLLANSEDDLQSLLHTFSKTGKQYSYMGYMVIWVTVIWLYAPNKMYNNIQRTSAVHVRIK